MYTDSDKNKETMYIDFDKNKQVFYINLYFDDYNISLKISLTGIKNRISNDDIKIEKFDLTKYVYLLHYK